MKRVSTLMLASVLLIAVTFTARTSIAGPAEEANAALDRFSAAYTANDIEALVQLYAPNAILLGTNSPIISEGRDAVRAYFTDLKLAGSGNKNQIQDRRTHSGHGHANFAVMHNTALFLESHGADDFDTFCR